jgi:Rad3-related DNA helicase
VFNLSFPYKEYRPYQKEVIDKIENLFGKYKYIFLEAPTGSGKSGIYITVSRNFNKVLFMTPQKVLQDQISNDDNFKDFLYSIKGRNNYECGLGFGSCQNENCTKKVNSLLFNSLCKDKKLNFDLGSDKKELQFFCELSGICPYLTSREDAVNSQIVIMNSSYCILVCNYFLNKGFKDVLIVDEAHNLENVFASHINIEFNIKNIKNEYNINCNFSDYKKHNLDYYLDYFKKYLDILFDESLKLFEDIEKTELGNKNNSALYSKLKRNFNIFTYFYNINKIVGFDEEDLSKINKIISKAYKKKITKIKFEIEKNNYVYYYDKYKNKLIIKPLDLSFVISDFLKKFDKVIFGSATLFSKKILCRNFGIDFKEAVMIKVPSYFPEENNKILYCNIGNVNYKKKEKMDKKGGENGGVMLDRINNKKGIMQGASYDL